MKNFELTVIIPVYNEEDNLERVFQQMSSFMEIATKKNKSFIYQRWFNRWEFE